MTDGMITVVGNIGQEPSRKATPRGEVVEFSIAWNERVQQADGTWADGATTWYQVNAWDRLGTNAASSLHKGQPVVVHGVLQTREWQGQDGQARRTTTLQARVIGHDLSHGTAQFQRVRAAAAGSSVAAGAQPAPVEPADPPAADWGAPSRPAVLEPAPAGWTTTSAAEEDTPF